MRTIYRLCIAIVLAILVVPPVTARFTPLALPDLLAAKNLKCTFTSAVGVDPAEAWPTTKSTDLNEVLRFDHIDVKRGTARLIAATNPSGAEESTDVSVRSNDAGIYFIKTAPTALSLTFVFAEQIGVSRFKASSSRQVMRAFAPTPGSVTASQEYGSCEAWK